MKEFFWAAAILVVSTSVSAEMPATGLYSVNLVFSTKTVTGYINPLLESGFDATKPGAAELVRSWKRVWFYEDIQEVKVFTEAPILVTDKSPGFISTVDLISVSTAGGKINGWVLDGQTVIQVPSRALQLLKTKPPVFHCRVSYSDVPQHNWISWNPKVDGKQLQDLCNRTYETRPTDAEKKAVLSKPDVFDLIIGGD